MTEDTQLLRQYVDQQSEDAFTELVRKHLDLVYSAAFRQVGGDAHLARDVAQTVFIDLARKARALTSHRTLAGWLYTSTRFAASKSVRSDQRRRQREESAQAMNSLTNELTPDWEKVQPLIDEAISSLSQRDRDALLLRYFENRSYSDIGKIFNLSEDAVRLRVTRALEKTQQHLSRRGITSTSAILTTILSANAAVASPAGLATTISATAVTTPVASGLFVILSSLAGATYLKIGLAALCVASASVITLQKFHHNRTASAPQTVDALPEKPSQAIAETKNTSNSAEITPELVNQVLKLIDPAAPELSPAQRLHVEQLASNPEYKRLHLSRRRSLDNSYALLFRRLNLPPDKTSKLFDLMISKDEFQSLMRSMARDKTILPQGADRALVRDKASEPFDTKIRELLGPSGYEYYVNYEQTLPNRQLMLRLSRQLDNMGEPVSDITNDRLTELRVAYWPETNGLLENPNPFLTQAKALLSPLQFKTLERICAAESAVRCLLTMNRKAADQGRLKPTAYTRRTPTPSGPSGNVFFSELMTDPEYARLAEIHFSQRNDERYARFRQLINTPEKFDELRTLLNQKLIAEQTADDVLRENDMLAGDRISQLRNTADQRLSRTRDTVAQRRRIYSEFEPKIRELLGEENYQKYRLEYQSPLMTQELRTYLEALKMRLSYSPHPLSTDQESAIYAMFQKNSAEFMASAGPLLPPTLDGPFRTKELYSQLYNSLAPEQRTSLEEIETERKGAFVKTLISREETPKTPSAEQKL
jgi:RNA polymerase sigma factor (sigma-70 family)